MKESNPRHQDDVLAALLKPDRTAWLKGGQSRCRLPSRAPAGKVSRIVLLGAPGVGMETQVEMLCDRLGTCHLSISDILSVSRRCPQNALTPAMQNALDYLQRGETVPDETVLNLVGERLHCLSCAGGFLLDGFPRTVAQAKALEQLLENHDTKLTAVFHYDLPPEKIVARLSGRRTCMNCQAVFHLATRPPKTADTCDYCEGKLFQRDDERAEAVTLRVEQYQAAVRPLLGFYQQRGLLVTIDADGAPEKVYQRTRLSTLVS